MKKLGVYAVSILALILIGGCTMSGFSFTVDELDTNEIIKETENE